ncbi:hypothetical protein CC78DRAFT_479763 [Lojkania enalia]|uniref:Uncharacterized protein n=1 Tax=Lojkania enalia TaxID=147567 RepID=A0A9P4K0U1_9PLEO|nr:hypothetical protein CC78DRAFT_479763 [Didymosphaeria enalia]
MGINCQDFVRALEMIDSEILGGKYSCYILRAGAKTSFARIQRAVACAENIFQTYLIYKAAIVVKPPENISSVEASGLPVTLIKTYYSLPRFMQLRKGEMVLIYLGTGVMGHAVIQPA